jgi:hypothetical protein
MSRWKFVEPMGVKTMAIICTNPSVIKRHNSSFWRKRSLLPSLIPMSYPPTQYTIHKTAFPRIRVWRNKFTETFFIQHFIGCCKCTPKSSKIVSADWLCKINDYFFVERIISECPYLVSLWHCFYNAIMTILVFHFLWHGMCAHLSRIFFIF